MDYTRHAHKRMCQRNLSVDDIEFVIQHACPEYRTGVRFYHLLRKDLPPDLPGSSPYRRLVGTTVLVCHCECIITAYRNTNARKRDRRKQDYHLHECPYCGHKLADNYTEHPSPLTESITDLSYLHQDC